MNIYQYTIYTILLCLSFSKLSASEKHYDLRIKHITANFTGIDVRHALGIEQTFPEAIEAAIPAPTLRFKLGDIAVITVHNDTTEPATLHWHGLLVPYKQDGPQFSNTKIIEPGTKHIFRFPIRHTGTYWYHSHTQLQEQRGLYGAIVIDDAVKDNSIDHDVVFVMSDWVNKHPMDVLHNLKKDGHYYSLKKADLKKAIVEEYYYNLPIEEQQKNKHLLDKDYIGTLYDSYKNGHLDEFINGEISRMGPMDFSDVAYDAYLINGKIQSYLDNVRHGEKIRFRIINASASTYFYFNIGKNRNFKVISKDGMPVQKTDVNQLLIGIAETYDIVFEMPHMMKTFEAKITAQDRTGSASMMFGMGAMEKAPIKLPLSSYEMDHSNMGENNHNSDNSHDQKPEDGHHNHPMPPMGKVKQLNYGMLKSVTPTNFSDNLIRSQIIDLELSGDMERYTWNINGKAFTEDKYIDIKENEVITFRFINKTMMHHPMHLHGHFFRVLNGQGNFAPLFHTVDVAPMKTVTIEFHANEPGIWFLHCHNLYHMKMGMARLVRYEGFTQDKELKEDEIKWGPKMMKDNSPFFRTESAFYNNKAEFNFGVNSGNYEVELELEVDEYHIENLEAELILKKYLNRFLSLGAAGIHEDSKQYYAIMATYNMPGNIEFEGFLRNDGKAILKIKKRIPLININNRPLVLDIEPEISYKDQKRWNFKSELMYNYTERLSFGLSFEKANDSTENISFGIKFRF